MNKKIYIPVISLLFFSAASAQSLSLKEYQEKVVDYSQQLKQAREQVTASTAKMKASYTGFLPKLDLVATGTIDLTNLDLWDAPVAFGSYHPYHYWGGATLTQPIYAGNVYNQYKADKIQSEISQQQQMLTLDNIYMQADQVYWTVAANSEILRVSRQYHQIIKTQYELIKTRFDDGAIARNDLLMITTRLKDAELTLKKAEVSYQIACQNMNILMGAAPEGSSCNTDSITSPIASPAQVSFDNALDRRPDYKTAQLQIGLVKANKNLAMSKFNPYLNLQAQGGWGTGDPNYGYDPRWAVLTSLNFSMPLFHWGERIQTNRQLRAQLNSTRYNLQIVSDQISKETANAWTQMDQSYVQINVAEESLQLAQEALDLNTYSYNEGRITISDVLSSQLSWIQSYMNMIQAHYSYKIAVANYKKSVGTIVPEGN